MTFVSFRRIPLIALLSLGSLMLSTLVAAPHAAAHDPIFLSNDQTTPDLGPYMPDGMTSWALYGEVLDVDDTRGFEFDLRDGDDLYISLLIPNLSPELELAEAELPVIELESPSGEVRTLVNDMREVFDEPFSKTSYVTLNEIVEAAEAGRYRGVVIGNAPARFSVAIGLNEVFFTEAERTVGRPTSFQGITAPLQAWYTTPPGADAPVETDLAEGEAEIDLDMIEDAMDTGGASIEGEGSIRGEAEDAGGTAMEEAMEEEPEAVDTADVDTDASADADSADETETAAAPADDDADGDGGSNSWVAPVVLAIAAIAGAGFFMSRRNSDASSNA